MDDMAHLLALALDAGFTYAGPLDIATVALRQEVRDMCAKNTCGQYGSNWSCPPGCGELGKLRKQLSRYRCGLLVQTAGELEDSFDIDGMLEIETLHKAHMLALQSRLRERCPRVLAIGAGCCTLCAACTYPHAPCRFPDRQIASMEAWGMVVSEVCRANHMPYRYGPNTMVYTGCFLVQQRPPAAAFD